jgi:endoglucanase
MAPGINLGNTLEAIPKETSWGNPEPTEAFFKGVRAAGFKSVRIPVSWTQYSDGENNIQPTWMRHVTDVTRMALDADLYVMINIHWDGGWLQPTPQKQEAATQKLRKFWRQIATNFRDFDHRVMFAGTNETGVEGQYGMPAPENAAIQNRFNEAFVGTVRSTGGRNSDRYLVVQTYATDIDAGLKYNQTLPADSVKDRLMIEVHYYSPYNFVLNDKSDVWQWGKSATDPKATDTWGNEDYVDAQFAKVQAAFVDRGIPVILGEYSAGMKSRFPGMDKYRRLWDEYVTSSAVRHSMVPMLWDVGSIINRETGAPIDVDLIRRINLAVKSASSGTGSD